MGRPRRPRAELPAGRSPSDASRGISWRPAAILVATLLAYSNTLSAPFVFDDRLSIVENASIRAWHQLDTVLFPERELPVAGRPLVNLSFALNYAAGGLHVFGYHVVNLALHLACALLVFGLVRRTLELPVVPLTISRRSTDLALFGLCVTISYFANLRWFFSEPSGWTSKVQRYSPPKTIGGTCGCSPVACRYADYRRPPAAVKVRRPAKRAPRLHRRHGIQRIIQENFPT